MSPSAAAVQPPPSERSSWGSTSLHGTRVPTAAGACTGGTKVAGTLRPFPPRCSQAPPARGSRCWRFWEPATHTPTASIEPPSDAGSNTSRCIKNPMATCSFRRIRNRTLTSGSTAMALHRSRYAYRPGSEFTHQREPSRVMTAEALLMRQYLGWLRDNSSMVGGAQWLHTNLPHWGPFEKDAFRSNRDAYYWYYATQVMFQMQGDYWKDWNDRLRELLVDSQEQTGGLAGSWHPLRPVPDRWGNEGGRLYVTALH